MEGIKPGESMKRITGPYKKGDEEIRSYEMQERTSNAGRACCGYEWIADRCSVVCVVVGRVFSCEKGINTGLTGSSRLGS